jgi:fatty-acyl-CoA synthase
LNFLIAEQIATNFYFQADRLASALLNLGLNRGDSVGIWSPNFEFWYVSMMAIARAGLVTVS